LEDAEVTASDSNIALCSDVNLLVKNPVKNGYKISGTNPIKSLIKSMGERLQIIKKRQCFTQKSLKIKTEEIS